MSDQGRLVAGRYRLAELIGRGGMGTVWRAEDELLGRQVAVKKLRVPPQLHDDERETLYERTRREARSAARINHPNVVVVHDVVEDEGLPCIVMEYVPSRTLGDVLKNDGPVTPREAARIGRGMIAALRAAHRAGVLHRDVKPANVLLGRENPEDDDGWPGGRIVLTDFGIASATGTSTLTRTGELIGSFDYLAPERITGGTPGPASDLWALGATLYQAVEGEAPFHRDTPIETAYAIASDPVPPPRRAGALTPLIESLLAKDPEQRMPAEEVERLLVSSVETVVSHGVVGSPGAWPAPRPHPDHDEPPTTALRPAVPRQGPPEQEAEEVTTAQAPGARTATRSAPPPEAAPARPSRRGRQLALACSVAVAAAGLAVGGELLARGGGSASADNRVDGGKTAPSAGSSGSAQPAPTIPTGYHIAQDPAGFSMAVPDSWVRKAKPNGDVDYVNTAEKADLLVSVLDFAGPSPLQHFKELEQNMIRKQNGYSLLRMNPTTFTVGGQTEQAAIWEWKWSGEKRIYHAIDLAFSKEGGTEYALYLSAPDDGWANRLKVFDTARQTFRPGR